MPLEPITISLIEYRALAVFLIVVPSVLAVATIKASLWLAQAFVRLRARQ